MFRPGCDLWVGTYWIRDFKNAASRDPCVRRELADLIRDACINVSYVFCYCCYKEIGGTDIQTRGGWWSLSRSDSFIVSLLPAWMDKHLEFIGLRTVVKNHGISQELIEGAINAGKSFFSLSELEKMKVRVDHLFRSHIVLLRSIEWLIYSSISINPLISRAIHHFWVKTPMHRVEVIYTKDSISAGNRRLNRAISLGRLLLQQSEMMV